MEQAPALPEHYIRGDSDTTIFMLHGAYGDGRYFENTAAVLAAAGYRVVVWTCPGYGQETPVENFSIEYAAAAARTLIEAKATTTNILLGHSMGCLIAPAAAKLSGTRIDGIILSCASVGFQNRAPEDQKRFLAERIAPITEQGLKVAEYAPALLTKMMAPGARGGLVDKVRNVISEMKTETFMASMKAITSYSNEAAIAAINVPTLLVSGEFDTACPPEGMEKLHAIIPDSEYLMVEGSGHYPFAERADTFHEYILEFLNRRFANETAVSGDATLRAEDSVNSQAGESS